MVKRKSKKGKKSKSKKGIVTNVRGKIPYYPGYPRKSKKATVLGGRVVNTGQRIKSGLLGGPGGWSTSRKSRVAGLYNIGGGLVAPTEIQRLGVLAHKKRRYKKNEIAMVFDEILPSVTCTANCIKSNLGHRLGLNKSKYKRYKRRR